MTHVATITSLSPPLSQENGRKKHSRFSLGHLPRRPQQPTQARQGSRPRLTRQDLPLEADDSPGRGRLRIPPPARREGRRPGGGQDSPHPQGSGPRPKYPAGHPVRATLPRGSEASPGTRGIARPHRIQHPTPGGQGQGPGGPGPAEERAGRAARRRRQSHGGSCAFGPPGREGFGHMLGGSGHRLQAAAGVRGNPELRERWDAAPRGGWGRSGSRSLVLTSASCWCVP